jgi:hypothetical protein
MNDFSELEKQLKQLQPVAPSENLIARIEQALSESEDCRASLSDAAPSRRWRWRFTETPYKVSLGWGLLATAALVLVFARINLQQPAQHKPNLAAISPVPSVSSTTSGATLVPVGLTQVTYSTRDEGLHFPTSSTQPMRRIRSQKRETMQWHNPATGASLRISYPSEEVSLTPVSGE